MPDPEPESELDPDPLSMPDPEPPEAESEPLPDPAPESDPSASAVANALNAEVEASVMGRMPKGEAFGAAGFAREAAEGRSVSSVAEADKLAEAEAGGFASGMDVVTIGRSASRVAGLERSAEVSDIGSNVACEASSNWSRSRCSTAGRKARRRSRGREVGMGGRSPMVHRVALRRSLCGHRT